MSNKVLITGATGNVGSEIIRHFTDKSRLRAAVYDMEEARQKLGDSIESVFFDFKQPETFAPAFEGVERVFLLRPPAIADVKKDIAPAIEAAKQAGVQHIVFLSIQGVENNHFVPHYKIEVAIEESGLSHTFLRCGFFMQNLSTTHRAEIKERHEIAIPAGKSQTAFVDVRDIAAVAAKILAEHDNQNRVYTLTGSEALNYYQVADILSDVLHTDIHYTDPFVLKFVGQQRAAGRSWDYTLVTTMLYTITRLGNAKQVSHDVEALLGRPPISFRQFAEDYQTVWN